MPNTLRVRLAESGYREAGSLGPFPVMIRPGGAPICLYAVEDWPMLLVFRLRGVIRAVPPNDFPVPLKPPVRVLLRRGDDLEPIGETTLQDNMALSPALPMPGTWALADALTPAGVDVASQVAEAVLRASPCQVVLIREFTSRLSTSLLGLTISPRGPILGPAISGEERATRVALFLRLGKITLADLKPEEAAQLIVKVEGVGC